jgi:hypothetical protein
VGDRHDLRIPFLLGGPSSQGVRFFVARRALMSFDPDEVDGLALASQAAHHIPDASRYALARACTRVASPCDRTCRVRMDGHVPGTLIST